MNRYHSLNDYQRRRNILAQSSFRVLKACIEGDEPSEGDLGLLVLTLVDAAMDGDQQLLGQVPRVIEHLRGCLNPENPDFERWTGRLEILSMMQGFADALLLVHRRATGPDPQAIGS